MIDLGYTISLGAIIAVVLLAIDWAIECAFRQRQKKKRQLYFETLTKEEKERIHEVYREYNRFETEANRFKTDREKKRLEKRIQKLEMKKCKLERKIYREKINESNID